MLKILYLSKNMQQYKSAMYQRDVMQELENQAEVYYYGPGFSKYDESDNILDIINKLQIKPDWIIVGHAWLIDTPGVKVDPHPELDLSRCQIPKAMILNKEYTNLEEKLAWVKNNSFNVAFSHHHDTEKFGDLTGVPFIFWPFAYNDKLFFSDQTQEKDVDFAFSGILQNQSKKANQTDTRIKVMKKIFLCFGDLPLAVRKKYRKYSLFWNAIPRSNWQKKIARISGLHRYLEDEEYRDIQQRSKLYLNTLSPAGLISPRFAENMASRALVFCEASSLYENVFPNHCLVTFKSDLSDFDEKFHFYLNNDKARNEIVERAYLEAKNNHTWRKRVEVLIEQLKSFA